MQHTSRGWFTHFRGKKVCWDMSAVIYGSREYKLQGELFKVMALFLQEQTMNKFGLEIKRLLSVRAMSLGTALQLDQWSQHAQLRWSSICLGRRFSLYVKESAGFSISWSQVSKTPDCSYFLLAGTESHEKCLCFHLGPAVYTPCMCLLS